MDDSQSVASTIVKIPTSLPMTRKLEQVYTMNFTENRQRYEKIGKRFKDWYGETVQYLIRVPGQLKVPMEQAEGRMFDHGIINLEQDVVVAISRTEQKDSLKIGNMEKAKYPVVSKVEIAHLHQRISSKL